MNFEQALQFLESLVL